MKFDLDIFKNTKVSRFDNRAIISGIIASPIVFTHSFSNKRYFKTVLNCRRFSGTTDCIQVVFNEDLLNRYDLKTGDYVKFSGYVKSHTKKHTEHSNTEVIFINALEVLDLIRGDNIPETDNNVVYLKGKIIKKSKVRGVGGRAGYKAGQFDSSNQKLVCDNVLMVEKCGYHKNKNGQDKGYSKNLNGKDDKNNSFIPCIFWGALAHTIQIFPEFSELIVVGRLQSRTYVKNLDKEKITKTTYELSVFDLLEIKSYNKKSV